MHLDHIDPATKTFAAAWISRARFDEALPELLKCQVLCAECHYKKHRERRNGHSDGDGEQLSLFFGGGTYHYDAGA